MRQTVSKEASLSDAFSSYLTMIALYVNLVIRDVTISLNLLSHLYISDFTDSYIFSFRYMT